MLADHAGDVDKVRTRVSHGRPMMSGQEQATVCEQLSSQVIIHYPREEALAAIVPSTATIVDDARRAFDSSARLSHQDIPSSPDLQQEMTAQAVSERALGDFVYLIMITVCKRTALSSAPQKIMRTLE